MKSLQQTRWYKQYNIPLLGLKKGEHLFTYLIDGNFFQGFETSPLTDAQVKVLLKVDKKANLFIFDFELQGAIRVACDRCLEEFDLPIFQENQVLLKYKHSIDVADKSDENVVYVRYETPFFNVAQLIYEFVVLALPIQKVHPNDEQGNSLCNPQILAILAGKNSDKTTGQSDGNDTSKTIIDPRWAALKNLKR